MAVAVKPYDKVREPKEVGDLVVAVRIVISRKVSTVVASPREIVINPNFFRNLPLEEKIFILAHEIMHLMFGHPAKIGFRDPKLWNIACEVFVNEKLSKVMRVPKYALTVEKLAKVLGVPPDDLRRMRAEEIYELLKKKVEAGVDVVERLKEMIPREYWGMPGAGELDLTAEEEWLVVKERDEGVIEITDSWIRELRRLVELAEGVKEVWEPSDSLKESVEKLLEQIVNLVEEMRMRLSGAPSGTGGPSGRTVWILVDVSSISGKELKQFMNTLESKSIVGSGTNVKVLTFNVDVTGEFDVRTSDDVERIARELRGRGDSRTEIEKVLKKLLERMKLGDVVAILTNSDICDIDKQEVKNMLKEVVQKASIAIFATVDKEVELPEEKWWLVKIGSEGRGVSRSREP